MVRGDRGLCGLQRKFCKIDVKSENSERAQEFHHAVLGPCSQSSTRTTIIHIHRRYFRRAMAALEVGQPAPRFTCKDQTGATVELDHYAGKSLLIWFYPRASTGG